MTAFENWFSADFQKLMHSVKPEDGVFSSTLSIEHASWDRRAAFLLWDAMGRPNAAWVEQMAPLYYAKTVDDLLGDSPAPKPRDDLEDLL